MPSLLDVAWDIAVPARAPPVSPNQAAAYPSLLCLFFMSVSATIGLFALTYDSALTTKISQSCTDVSDEDRTCTDVTQYPLRKSVLEDFERTTPGTNIEMILSVEAIVKEAAETIRTAECWQYLPGSVENISFYYDMGIVRSVPRLLPWRCQGEPLGTNAVITLGSLEAASMRYLTALRSLLELNVVELIPDPANRFSIELFSWSLLSGATEYEDFLDLPRGASILIWEFNIRFNDNTVSAFTFRKDCENKASSSEAVLFFRQRNCRFGVPFNGLMTYDDPVGCPLPTYSRLEQPAHIIKNLSELIAHQNPVELYNPFLTCPSSSFQMYNYLRSFERYTLPPRNLTGDQLTSYIAARLLGQCPYTFECRTRVMDNFILWVSLAWPFIMVAIKAVKAAAPRVYICMLKLTHASSTGGHAYEDLARQVQELTRELKELRDSTRADHVVTAPAAPAGDVSLPQEWKRKAFQCLEVKI